MKALSSRPISALGKVDARRRRDGRRAADPGRTLTRAYYISVLFVIVLYVLVAVVAVGSVPASALVDSKDYALAVAARPALENPIWNQPLEGLIITAAATLALANVLNLESISTMGSAGFLIIFATVNVAEARTSKQRGSTKPWISIVAAVACVGALAARVAGIGEGAWQVPIEHLGRRLPCRQVRTRQTDSAHVLTLVIEPQNRYATGASAALVNHDFLTRRGP